MEQDWTKRTPRLSYINTDTNRYNIVISTPLLTTTLDLTEDFSDLGEQELIQMTQGLPLDSFEERLFVEATAWNLLTRYYGLDQNIYTWGKSGDFLEIIAGPIVSARPGGETLYLVSTIPSVEDLGAFLAPREPAQTEYTTHTVEFKNYDEFSTKMEILAMQLEEYAENPSRGLAKDRPGIVLIGPADLGYSFYDFKEESEKVRSFYSELAQVFKNNAMTGDESFEIGFRFPVTQINATQTDLPRDSTIAYNVDYVAEKTEGGLAVLNGFEAFFGLDLVQNLNSGPEVLRDKRTISLVANLNKIADEVLSSHPVPVTSADVGIGGTPYKSKKKMKVGRGCKLPPAAREEDVPTPKAFVDKYVRPKPLIGYSTINLEETFDKVSKQQPTLVTKEETTLYEDYCELTSEAVDNRNVKASDYVADAVWESLPNSPSHIGEIKTVDDAFGYVINKISIDTIIREILICIGLNYSIDDLLDMACDKLLNAVFGDVEKLEKLLTFLQSGDSALAAAFNKLSPEETDKLDGIGPTVYDLTDAISAYLKGLAAETAGEAQSLPNADFAALGPLDRIFSEDMEGAFKGDQKATKRFLCEVIIVGPFLGLAAIISLIKKWRDNKDEPTGFPKLPPDKQCDPYVKFPDKVPMLDQIEQHIIDLLRKEADKFLEKYVVKVINDLLYNLYAACRREDENNFGAYNTGRLPLGDDAEPDDMNLCPDLDFDELMDDLYSSLTPSELCSLFKGTASDDLLNYALRYFNMQTAGCAESSSLKNLNTTSKIKNYFLELAKNADLTACTDEELEDQADTQIQKIADLCLIGDSPKEELLARALALRGLTESEINKQLQSRKDMDEGVAKSLLELLTAPEEAEKAFGGESQQAILNSIQQSTSTAVATMFDPIRSLLAQDVSILIPTLFSPTYDLIQALTTEVGISVGQGGNWGTIDSSDLKSPGLFLYDTTDLTYGWHGYNLPINKQQIFDDATMAKLQNIPDPIMPSSIQQQIKEEIELLENMVDSSKSEYEYFNHNFYTFMPHEGYDKTMFLGTLQHSQVLKRIFYRWHKFLNTVYEDGVNIFDGTATAPAKDTSPGIPFEPDADGGWQNNSGESIIKLLHETIFANVPENLSDQQYYNDIHFWDPGYPFISGKEKWAAMQKGLSYSDLKLDNLAGADKGHPGFMAWLRWRHVLLPDAYTGTQFLGYADAGTTNEKMENIDWSKFRKLLDGKPGTWNISKTLRKYIADDREWYEKAADWVGDRMLEAADITAKAVDFFVQYVRDADPFGIGSFLPPRYTGSTIAAMIVQGDYAYGPRFSPGSSTHSAELTTALGAGRTLGPTGTDVAESPGAWQSFYFLLAFVGFAPEGKYERTQVILDWYKKGKLPSAKELSLFNHYWKRMHPKTKNHPGWDQTFRNRIEQAYLPIGKVHLTGEYTLARTGYTVSPHVLSEWDPAALDEENPPSATTEEVSKELRFKLLPPKDIAWAKDKTLPITTGYEVELRDAVTQLPIFNFSDTSDTGVYFDRSEIRNVVDNLLNFDQLIAHLASDQKDLKTKDVNSEWSNYNLPVEPQLFTKFVNASLLKGFNLVAGNVKYANTFGLGGTDDDSYGKILRKVLFETDVVGKPFFGAIFRDTIRHVAQDVSRRMQIYIDTGVFRDLNFLRGFSELMNLDQIKDDIVNGFSADVMGATEEKPAKLLVEHLVDWPTAGAIQALIKLKTVEACIKQMLVLLLIRPSHFYGSAVMVKYMKQTIRDNLNEFTYQGRQIFLDLDKVSEDKLSTMINQASTHAMAAIDKALQFVLPPGHRKIGAKFFSDIVLQNKPLPYGANRAAYAAAVSAAALAGAGSEEFDLKFTPMIDIAQTSWWTDSYYQRGHGLNKDWSATTQKTKYGKHWGLGNFRSVDGNYLDRNWVNTFFTQPRFTSEYGDQESYGFYLEKYVWYKMKTKEDLENLYISKNNYQVKNWKSHQEKTKGEGESKNWGSGGFGAGKGGEESDTTDTATAEEVTQSSLASEAKKFANWFVGRYAVEHIGDPEDLGSEIIICNHEEFQEIWGDSSRWNEKTGGDKLNETYTASDGNIKAWKMNLKENFAAIFEKFGGGLRLSYVFPPDRSQYDPSWWKDPLSAGNRHNFWKEFKNHGLNAPSNLNAQTPGVTTTFSAKDAIKRKMQKAYHMRETPAGLYPSTPASVDSAMFLTLPEIFVLPLLEVRKNWAKGDDKKAGWAERTYWEHGGKDYSRAPADWIRKVYEGKIALNNWSDRRKDLEELPLFKILFQLIFPVDKMVAMMAIRNSIAFEESIQIMTDACLDADMFPQTQKQLLFLIEWAQGLKEAKKQPDWRSSFQYAYQKSSLSDLAVSRFTDSLKDTFDVKSTGCRIREEQIAAYLVDKHSKNEAEKNEAEE